MAKCVVTGGDGFIGSHVVDVLLARGHEVHIVDTLVENAGNLLNKEAVSHKVDVRDTDELISICKGADAIFHLAALPRVQFSIEHPQESHDANVNGTLSVLTAAHAAGVRRVVYTASSSAYGDPIALPQTEDMPANPKSPYGLQKYMGEIMCRVWSEVYGIETVSLRYFNVYGPRANPNGAYAQVLPKFAQAICDGKAMTITGDGTQTRDMVHVRDVAEANMLAMESARVGKGEVINIGSGQNYSINDMARKIGKNIEYIEPRLEPHDTRADITKAKELLGWEPRVSLEDGIEELKKEFGIA